MTSNQKMILFILMIGNFLAIISTSSINIVLSSFMTIFGSELQTVQWVASIFLLANGLIAPITGWLGDRYTFAKIFVGGIIVFAISSLLCSVAWSIESLIFFRFLQGLAAGVIVPASMTLIYLLIEREKQPFALSLWTLGAMFGPAIGPTLAGFLVGSLSWHWLFLINIPFCVAVVILSKYYLKANEESSLLARFDTKGFLLIVFGTVGIVYSLNIVETQLVLGISLFLVGCALIMFYVFDSFKKQNPILKLSVFKIPSYTYGLLISFFLLFNLYAATLFMPIYLQDIRGISVLETGLILMPAAICMGIINLFAGNHYSHQRMLVLGIVGVTGTVIGSFLLGQIDLNTSIVFIMVALTLRNMGIAVTFTVVSAAGMSQVPKELSGHGSAVLNWLRQTFSAVALTVISIVISAITLLMEGQGIPYREAFTQNVSTILIVGGLVTLLVIPLLWVCSRNLLQMAYGASTVD
ncbi:DHA2 family efflux MFS transporter permease subunit [Lysinibacillus sp. KU-BSD001]|uniref:DHA2 family efflux MFS transporter permease subunit n=1 Tax=Lysinibacillus sp. KU-BSD001 TaxID=3141328 RepID=UPI0036E191F5